MAISGTALLSPCWIAGLFLGRLIGDLFGPDINVGGAGGTNAVEFTHRFI